MCFWITLHWMCHFDFQESTFFDHWLGFSIVCRCLCWFGTDPGDGIVASWSLQGDQAKLIWHPLVIHTNRAILSQKCTDLTAQLINWLSCVSCNRDVEGSTLGWQQEVASCVELDRWTPWAPRKCHNEVSIGAIFGGFSFVFMPFGIFLGWNFIFIN